MKIAKITKNLSCVLALSIAMTSVTLAGPKKCEMTGRKAACATGKFISAEFKCDKTASQKQSLPFSDCLSKNDAEKKIKESCKKSGKECQF